MRNAWFIIPFVGFTLAAAPAFADPCTAPLPEMPGEVFTGVVRYVGDGDSFCVGADGDPRTWIEVRLADFDAPELHAAGGFAAKDRLQRLVFGRALQCAATRGRRGAVRVHDRVIAACRVGGRPLGALLRANGGTEGGR